MALINFPNSPIVNQTYTFNPGTSEEKSYIFNAGETGASDGYWAAFPSTSFGPATTAEIDAGTEVLKYIAPDQLEASKYNYVASEVLQGKARIATSALAIAGVNDTDFITSKKMRDGFNAAGAAPVYACRAWVNFDGTGVAAIRDSGNVSSVTDLDLGRYTVNFITDMTSINYGIQITASGGYNDSAVVGEIDEDTPPTISNLSMSIMAITAAAQKWDSPIITVGVFGE